MMKIKCFWIKFPLMPNIYCVYIYIYFQPLSEADMS